MTIRNIIHDNSLFTYLSLISHLHLLNQTCCLLIDHTTCKLILNDEGAILNGCGQHVQQLQKT